MGLSSTAGGKKTKNRNRLKLLYSRSILSALSCDWVNRNCSLPVVPCEKRISLWPKWKQFRFLQSNLSASLLVAASGREAGRSRYRRLHRRTSHRLATLAFHFFFCSLGRFVVKISRAGRLLRDTSRLAGWETATVFRNCVEFWPPSHFQQISSAVPAGECDVACFFLFFSFLKSHQNSFHSPQHDHGCGKTLCCTFFSPLVCP